MAVDQRFQQIKLTNSKIINLFKDNKVSSQLIEALLKQVSFWHGKGIRVIGLRPPVSKSVYNIENEVSGFQEEVFSLAFQQAGGTWVTFNPADWPTYDGHHLNETVARHFSLTLGLIISQ